MLCTAYAGARWHRRRDRAHLAGHRCFLLVCGSLGVMAYLNLKAGTSFGWQLVPDPAHHEARDRDYFFVLGFWAWGIWAGIGALVFGSRLSRRYLPRWRYPRPIGVVLAALPIALNWSAMNRRSEPEASLPREVASALLDRLPSKAVLFVGGDNDTYPLWYAQEVEHRRTDVTVVTMPLLGARLEYGEELDAPLWPHQAATSRRGSPAVARGQGRPVAVALTVALDAETRKPIGREPSRHHRKRGGARYSYSLRPEAAATFEGYPTSTDRAVDRPNGISGSSDGDADVTCTSRRTPRTITFCECFPVPE